MKLLFRLAYLLLTLTFLVYTALPSPGFPEPLPGAKQSTEPADTETPLRRAYFVDQNREEVISHYQAQFSGFPTLGLNYPPEEAQTIIRDQTRSSYLEELVHPFRESLYINGFEPKVRKDAIVIEGREYNQKIIVRYVPSNLFVRLTYVVLAAVTGYLVILFLGWFGKEIWRVLKLQ